MPTYARTTLPWSRSCPYTARARLLGTAKPIPCPFSLIAVLTPTTRPRTSTRGPPLLPWLIEASVWMKSW